MRCEDVRDRTEESRLGLIPAEEGTAFRAHVASCDACAADLREAEAFEGILDLARDRQRDDEFLSELLSARRRVRTRRLWSVACSSI